MSNPQDNLIQLASERHALAEAWHSQTGLRPSQTVLCQRVDHLDVVRTWFEPKPHQDPWTFILFGKALEDCRDQSAEQRTIATQRALLTFAGHSDMPRDYIDEATNNLTIVKFND
jgi:hypothetical protein